MIATDELNRKQSILKEAARLFQTLGYSATSMRDLASAVGIEAASLYNHISGKQELLRTICMTIAERHLVSLSKVENDGSSAISKIEGLVRWQIRINTELPQMAAVANDQWRHLDEADRRVFIQKRNVYEHRLRDWITEAINVGQLREADVPVVLYTLLSSLQWLHHWFREERSISPEEIEEEMITLLFKGLTK